MFSLCSYGIRIHTGGQSLSSGSWTDNPKSLFKTKFVSSLRDRQNAAAG